MAQVAQTSIPGDLSPGGLTETGLTVAGQRRIFFASFLTLIAAGIGFAVRGGILGDWGAQFGFTKSDLGSITGGGLAGFGITIIICSIFADRIGYKALLIGAFTLHVLSAILTLAATPVFHAAGKDATYWTLYVGMFLFALGNGLCEAAINPLVATLFPRNKTHYLNILHAGWPAGLVVGALIAYLFAGEGAAITHLRWEILIATFLVPAVWYGLIVVRERFPRSETHAAGISLGEQLATVAAPLFLFLILIHAMVGYVELGTDSWIANILNNVVGSMSLLLFIYISGLMFALRFFAGPIIHRINPLGLLFVAACCGAVGLFMLGSFKAGAMLVVAGTIFAPGQDVLLADDARRRRRAVPAGRGAGHGPARRRRDDVGRLARHHRHRLQAGPQRLRLPPGQPGLRPGLQPLQGGRAEPLPVLQGNHRAERLEGGHR